MRKNIKTQTQRQRQRQTQKQKQRQKQRQNKKKQNSKRVKFNLRKNKINVINRRTKKNIKRNRKNNKRHNRKSLKGGAIPFSELSLSYDNVKYGVDNITSAFGDNAPSAPNNPESSNVDPNPTTQFIRTESTDSSQLGPSLGEIFNANY